jgi:hypothetical protein
VGQGRAELLVPRAAAPDNSTGQDFMLIQWQGDAASFDLVAVNLANHRSQCVAPIRLPDPLQTGWQVTDLLGSIQNSTFVPRTSPNGLFLDLPEFGAQLLHFEPLPIQAQ